MLLKSIISQILLQSIKNIMSINLIDIKSSTNVDIGRFTTMKIPAKVKKIYYPKNEQELVFLYDYLLDNNMKFVILGNGSNTIFTKKSNNLVIIYTKFIKNHISKRENIVSVSSSVMLSKLYRYCQENSLSGFEKLASIPATVGGAIMMNAGCFGENICDNLLSIKVHHNRKTYWIKKEKLNFGYRNSNLNDYLILSAKFSCHKKDKCEIEQDYIKYLSIRFSKQPKGLSSGSFFKNTPTCSAGELIEKCGLKGFAVGGAKVSEKHANFIINFNNSTSEDILKLIKIIKKSVYQKFKINLEEEVKIY